MFVSDQFKEMQIDNLYSILFLEHIDRKLLLLNLQKVYVFFRLYKRLDTSIINIGFTKI